MDLETALKFVDRVLDKKVQRSLRPPEITVFSGTWQGITYEQMAQSSSYSANYLMRDIAPKFWKLLSAIFETNIGKSNLKVKLCKLYDSSQLGLVTGPQAELEPQHYHQSWQNAITFTSVFHGREREIERVCAWAIDEHCQSIDIWGLSGTGKTLLMKKIGELLQSHYEVVIWRSLVTAPLFNDLALELLQAMGCLPTTTVNLVPQLVEQMRSRRCLIMLDGVESLLQTQALNGQYRDTHAEYHNFFKVASSSSHRSCIITTSLENFSRTILPSSNSKIRQLKLEGLASEAARAVFNLTGTETLIAAQELIDYYQGNPAILSFVAQIIRKLFNGNISEFAAQKSMVFGEIDRLLGKSFSRLSSLETEILYWLASEPQAMSLSEIQTGIPLSIYPQELIEALESLSQRGLVEVAQIEARSVFTLSPMIREFAVDRLIATIGNNFSLANRQTSLLSQGMIELGSSNQTVHLTQWLNNRFEPGWQSVETLFAASGRSPARLRSAFSLRGSEVIKRFKQVCLGTDNAVEVLLVIAVSQLESAIKICVQAQPPLRYLTLPERLRLNLLDPTGNILASIVAQSEDNFIQLPYFSGAKGEKFTISFALDGSRHQEKFLI
ncbi:MAG: DUF1822 family protein [Cyanobacteria bacterium J06623_7]